MTTKYITFCCILLLGFMIASGFGNDLIFRDCVRVYRQDGIDISEFGSRNFSSPLYPNNYPENLECIYQFIADPGHRVQLTFDDFSLGGNAPKCDHFIDLYTEVNGSFNFPGEQLSGRFCGSVSPGLRISLHNVAVIVFHARGEKGERGFHGKFQFLDGKYHLNARHKCGSFIKGKRHGSIFSPTYPGKYPANMVCTYKLFGDKGQRIRLFFKDFDLYFGGPHCPYDSLTVYDGDSNHAVIIQKLCGLQQTLEIFSESENLFLEFKSVDAPYAEHRGFEIEYKFARNFVDLGKMKGNDKRINHIRGTECDIHVVSNGESEHLIRSPNYPDAYPPNKTCTYILDGMQGPQKLEQVSLEFESFSVQSNFPECTDANISLYKNVQDVKEAKTDNTPDNKFCSPWYQPSGMYSGSGARMVLIFRSNNNADHGFQAKVVFKTDFGIPGDKVTDTNNNELCHFKLQYDDSIKPTDKTGNFFNSPRFPDDYLANSTCRYDLFAPKGYLVMIYFEQFSLHPGLSAADRGGDRVELHTIFENGTRLLYGNYTSEWSESIPGPVVSLTNKVTVEFISDIQYISTGFKAYYMFIPATKSFCHEDIDGVKTRIDGVLKDNVFGTFRSPGYDPEKGAYIEGTNCHWEIRVRPGYRVLLQPIDLNVEGKMSDDGMFSVCQYAVIRVFNDVAKPGKEFCGDVLKNPGVRQFVSESNVLHVSFLTSPEKVLNLKGFNFSWTEFRDDPSCIHPDLFQCAHNKFCISKDLKCNNLPNCGDWDRSDEDKTQCDERLAPSTSTPTFFHGSSIQPWTRTTVQPWTRQPQPTRQPKKNLNIKQPPQLDDDSKMQREQRQQPQPTSMLATMPAPTMAKGADCLSYSRLFSLLCATFVSLLVPCRLCGGQPVDDSFEKTAILAGCGVGLVLVLVLIIGCIIARRRWKRKDLKTNDRYPSIQRRPLNSTSMRSRYPNEVDLC